MAEVVIKWRKCAKCERMFPAPPRTPLCYACAHKTPKAGRKPRQLLFFSEAKR